MATIPTPISNPVNTIKVLASETQLPDNYTVISYRGDTIELSDSERREFAILSLYNRENECYLVCTKQSLNSNNYYGIKKRIKTAGYEIAQEAMADNALISRIYEIRNFDENQRATKNDSAVVAYFELMIAEALKHHISDVHIQTRQTGAVIKMRKHGEMQLWGNPMTQEEGSNLCSVIYNVLAENKQISFDPKAYQPAAVNYKANNEEVKLRYQSLPVYPDGFDVVLRVLPIGRDEEFTPLTKLGYTEQQVKDLIDAASRPVGSLIIAGVTGSGKSTTLKNLIMFINAHSEYKTKIYTIEDPPEYKIPNVSQIPVVRPKDGATTGGKSPFEAPITACMRADPDIIMIGEVRDGITGNLTKKAIQSGHQVLTTVHASSAVGIIDRFLDFDVSRSVLGSPDFLTALIYQKLLPKVCKHCSLDFKEHLMSEDVEQEDIELARRLSELVDLQEYPIRVRSKNGCEHCSFMGISGREVCAEILRIDLKIMELIMEGKTIELVKYWRGKSDGIIDSKNMNGKNCMEHAVQKMLTGIISPYDVESSFKPINELYDEDKSKLRNQDANKDKFNQELDSINEKVKNAKGSTDLWDTLDL